MTLCVGVFFYNEIVDGCKKDAGLVAFRNPILGKAVIDVARCK